MFSVALSLFGALRFPRTYASPTGSFGAVSLRWRAGSCLPNLLLLLSEVNDQATKASHSGTRPQAISDYCLIADELALTVEENIKHFHIKNTFEIEYFETKMFASLNSI